MDGTNHGDLRKLGSYHGVLVLPKRWEETATQTLRRSLCGLFDESARRAPWVDSWRIGGRLRIRFGKIRAARTNDTSTEHGRQARGYRVAPNVEKDGVECGSELQGERYATVLY